MPELSDSCEELNVLFGKPKDGDTKCFVEGIFHNRIFKEGVDTGYRIGGNVQTFLVNPEDKIIATLSSGIIKRILVGDKNTGYSLAGIFENKIVYSEI